MNTSLFYKLPVILFSCVVGLAGCTSTLEDTAAGYDAGGNEGDQGQSLGGSSSSVDAKAPTVPGGLKAEAGGTSVIITWNASTDDTGVTGYSVYRDGEHIGTATTPAYLDQGLTPNTDYHYTVSAFDAEGNESEQSQVLSQVSGAVIVDSTGPSKPAGLQANNITSSSVMIEWQPSVDNTGVVGYRIFRDGSDVGLSVSTSFKDEGLSASTRYVYKVSALDASENESLSSQPLTVTTAGDSVAPSIPVGLVVLSVESDRIAIKWDASTDDTATLGYRIFRNNVEIATSATPSYSDQGLETGTSYQYSVSAYDAAQNESSRSQPLLQSTNALDSEAPAVPSNLGVGGISGNSITLVWSASTDNIAVAGYKIFRNGGFIANSTELSYIDRGLVANTEYQYAISAYDAAGNESSTSQPLVQATSASVSSSSYVDLALTTRNSVKNAPIRTGVPFPYGELSSVDNLRLENEAGTIEYPAQFNVLAKWPDGSIKAVLVQLVTDVSVGSKGYRLAYGPSVSAANFGQAISIVQAANITIDTGDIKFVVTPNGLIGSLWQDSNNDGQYASGEQVVGSSDLFLVNALNEVEYTASQAVDSQVILEENGPLRAVIRATGSMTSADGDSLIKYLIRYYAYLGSDKLDVEYTLVDDRLEENVRDTDYGRSQLALSISDYGLRMQYLSSAPTQYRFGGEDNVVYEGIVSGEHYLLQKGTFTYNDGADEGHTFNYSGAGSGSRAPGWLAFDTGNRHMSVIVKDFWQQFPNELSIDGNTLTVGLHPKRALDGRADVAPIVQGEGGSKTYRRPNTFYFEREGGAKTYQMRFTFSDAKPTDAQLTENNSLFQTHELLLTATPEWYTSSGVFGELNVGTSPDADVGFDALMMRDIYEPSMIEAKPATNYGWRDYGDRLRAGWSNVVNGVRIPGWYNDTHVGATNFFKMYLRTGDQRWFNLAEVSTRHFMDIDVSHGPRQGYWNGFGAPTQPAGEIHAIKHDMVDHSARNIHRGHAHASGLVDYYLLTGDKRSYEVMMEIGNWWKFVTPYMFPLPFNFDAPNNQAGYREATRDYGWPLFVMNEYVRLTGDENYHRETSAHLVNYLIQWWQTPRERIGYDAETDTMSNTPMGKFNDASKGTGFWTMTRAGNYGNYNKANGMSPWMAGSLIGNIIEFYERDKEFAAAGKASGIDHPTLKEMLFQTINYVVKNGYDETKDYFVYAETIRQYGGGRTHIIYPLAYLDRLYKAELAAGRISNPEWYDKQAMWGDIAKKTYDDYMTRPARKYTQSYGWYGYEIVHPLDFFKIMSEAP